MKTAEEYLQAECPVFEPLFADKATKAMAQDIIKAMQAYAREACREQREICRSKYDHYQPVGEHYLSVQDRIKNAPEPTML
jgi:hypothetical protein